jgi:hypothetical protein
MDLKLHRPNGCCHQTGRPFAPGEPFFSALVRSKSALERIDSCVESWQGPPEHALAWWKSTFPAADSAGATLAPVDVLLDVLEQLDGRPDEAPLRYLLALELVRRRVLRTVDRISTEQPPAAAETGAGGAARSPELLLACRRRDAHYSVPVALPPAEAVAAVQDRLSALLWSGDAA